MNCIFEFKYTPFDEIFFTNSKPNKSLNQNTKIYYGIIYLLPNPLLDDKKILRRLVIA